MVIQGCCDILVFLLQVRRAKSVLERILVRGTRSGEKIEKGIERSLYHEEGGELHTTYLCSQKVEQRTFHLSINLLHKHET